MVFIHFHNKATESRNWPQYHGHVISSKIGTRSTSSSIRTFYRIEIKVKDESEIFGVNRYSCGWDDTKEKKQHMIASYKKGDSITFYSEPENKQQGVISNNPDVGPMKRNIAICILVFICLQVASYKYTNRKKQNT